VRTGIPTPETLKELGLLALCGDALPD
jgi:hypothetical protein